MHSPKKYKVCRRLGPGLFEKCQTDTYAVRESRRKDSRRMKRRRNMSDYNLQLMEKQRIRLTYGITEKQFRKYVSQSAKASEISSADRLLALLEARLDNTVYRLGLAPTRRAARQMVSHGHIVVNDKKIKVPSHSVREGDVVAVREGSKTSKLPGLDSEARTKTKVPSWLKFDMKQLQGEVVGTATKEESGITYDLASVIQFYSR